METKQSINEKQKNPILKKSALKCAEEIEMETSGSKGWVRPRLPHTDRGDGASVQCGAPRLVQPERKGRVENRGEPLGVPQSGSELAARGGCQLGLSRRQ